MRPNSIHPNHNQQNLVYKLNGHPVRGREGGACAQPLIMPPKVSLPRLQKEVPSSSSHRILQRPSHSHSLLLCGSTLHSKKGELSRRRRHQRRRNIIEPSPPPFLTPFVAGIIFARYCAIVAPIIQGAPTTIWFIPKALSELSCSLFNSLSSVRQMNARLWPRATSTRDLPRKGIRREYRALIQTIGSRVLSAAAAHFAGRRRLCALS